MDCLEELEEHIKEFKKHINAKSEDLIMILTPRAYLLIIKEKSINETPTRFPAEEPLKNFNGIEIKVLEDLPKDADIIVKLKKDFEKEVTNE